MASVLMVAGSSLSVLPASGHVQPRLWAHCPTAGPAGVSPAAPIEWIAYHLAALSRSGIARWVRVVVQRATILAEYVCRAGLAQLPPAATVALAPPAATVALMSSAAMAALATLIVTDPAVGVEPVLAL